MRHESSNDVTTKLSEESQKDSMMEQVTKQTHLLIQILDTLVDLKEDIKIVTTRSAETSEKVLNFVANKRGALKEELRKFSNIQFMMIQHIENTNEEET